MVRSMRKNSRIGARRSATVATAAAAVLALVLAGCGGGNKAADPTSAGGTNGSAAAPAGGEGGQLVVGVSDQILNLDPGLAPTGGRETIAVRNLIFDTLVLQGNDLKPVARLADSWTNPDDNTWIFKLHPGVSFTNGEPFNAEIAKYNVDRVLDPELQLSYFSQLSSIVDSVEATDADTLTIKTKGASPGLLTILAYMQMVPQKNMEEVGDDAFNKAPIGTGPFKFDKRVGDQVYLTRNDDYWGGKPKLDGVVFQTIPEVSSRIAALKSGSIHIANQIPPDLSATLTGNVKSETVTGTRIFFLAMNVDQAPFDDPAVRRAMSDAIDRESIVENLYAGEGVALNQVGYPAMLGYQKDIDGFAFDPDAARKVLEGITTPVVIDVGQSDATLAQAVYGQLEAAGLKNVTVRIVEDSAFSAAKEGGTTQAYVGSWGVAEGDLDAVLIRHFWSGRSDTSKYTNYSSPEMDKLIETEQAIVDPAKRGELFKPIADLLITDVPWAPIITPNEIYGVSTNVSGWEPSPIGLFQLQDTTIAG